MFVRYGSQHTQLLSHITRDCSISNIVPLVELGPVLCWLWVYGLGCSLSVILYCSIGGTGSCPLLAVGLWSGLLSFCYIIIQVISNLLFFTDATVFHLVLLPALRLNRAIYNYLKHIIQDMLISK